MPDRPPAPPTRGPLLVIGGHEDKEGERTILRAVARLAAGGPLLVATVASHSQVDALWDTYSRLFAELGVPAVEHLEVESRARADSPRNLELIEAAGALFFTGGDQLKITAEIGGTRLAAGIERLHRERGGLVAGTSAGAAVMPDTMLIGGRSKDSLKAGDRLEMAPGLGLLPGCIVDQHFSERGRIGRLVAALGRHPGALGIGIDENTAILVQDDRGFEVLGESGVTVLDGRGVSHNNAAAAARGEVLALWDLRMHVLGSGDRFDLGERRPSRPAADADPPPEAGRASRAA